VSFAVYDFAVVGGLSKLFEFEVGGGAEFFDINHVGVGLILAELFVECFEGGVTDY
jgi:hypothetical protein